MYMVHGLKIGAWSNFLIGDRLRELRSERNLNQADLGQISGVNPVTISQIERGANTTTETLQKLAEALGVTIQAFFCDLTEDEVEHIVAIASERIRSNVEETAREILKEIRNTMDRRPFGGTPPQRGAA